MYSPCTPGIVHFPLDESQKAAEAANEAKSTFLANMSHELRTPLNAIIGYSEMLIEDAEDENEDFIPDLDKINSSGKHLLGLINDILDLSKVESGKMELFIEEFDLEKILKEVAATITPLVEKNNKGAHNLVYPYDTLPQPGRMLKISDGVYWVRMNLPFALNHINLWVLKDNDGWAIVDTGVASAEIKSNWRTCFSGDMGSQKVNKVIVTHLHPDHIGLAGWINKKFSAPLYMSRSDYLMSRMLVSDTGREAPEEGKSLYRSAGFTEDELDSYAERFGGFGSAISKLPDSYNRLKDYDEIRIGNYDWEIVVGSGHCPEPVSYTHLTLPTSDLV